LATARVVPERKIKYLQMNLEYFAKTRKVRDLVKVVVSTMFERVDVLVMIIVRMFFC
jgi:hypothetical protein